MLNRIELESISRPKLIDNSVYDVISNKLSYIRDNLKNAEDIITTNEIPKHFSSVIEERISEYNEILLTFQNLINSKNDQQLFSQIQGISRKVDSLYGGMFDT